MKTEDSFGDQLTQAIQNSLIDFIKKNDWFKLDYNQRLSLDSAMLRKVHESVDMDSVMGRVKDAIESRLADSIMNSMATEIANDTKSIMCNKELREDIRSVIRAKIRQCASAIS